MQTILEVIYRPNAKEGKKFHIEILCNGTFHRFDDLVEPLYIDMKKTKNDEKVYVRTAWCSKRKISPWLDEAAKGEKLIWPFGYCVRDQTNNL